MQRFGFERFGGPDVFTTLTTQRPVPKADQVQLKVLGFGLNPYDASLRRGDQAASRPMQFPIVPGTDVVGQVTAIGAAITDFAIGDLVINYRPLGGYSEYVTASETKVIHKPSALSFMDAAALPQVGIAAYTVFTMLNAHAGQSLTILGAGGGIGSVLLQFAQAHGVIVHAVASAKQHAWLSQLGADTITTYADAEFRSDFVVDAINGGGDRTLPAKLVVPGGVVVTTAAVELPAGPFTALSLTKMAPTQAALNALVTVARTWGLTMRIAKRLPFNLAGVQAGHARLDAGNVSGKLVVMQPDPVLAQAHQDLTQL
ncbi:NADP-dependent oxidoreductase [Lacticaseibacillus baoqingensis]|uniref:NADP-dependent oxidoreductase n=1 Tax=Lacticaseibacillus baoqingensis TaxID=2486013 RepID=A0ABW4E6Q5_9LACO|nr:NADP-dependent oxidoreductase [Lacticaseibacillus baoqingensis]